jgi:multimeric flavodoxin WrbA
MKIVGVIGSARKKGNTYRMVKWILDSVKEQEPDAEIEIVALGGLDIRYCIACYRCFTRGGCVIDDDVEKVQEKMKQSDGIVFGAPSYLCQVPAQTKALLDRSHHLCHITPPWLEGKYSIEVSPSATGVGEDLVVEYLKEYLESVGTTSVGGLTAMTPTPGMFVEERFIKDQTEQKGKKYNIVGIFLEEEKVREEAKKLGIKLVEAIKKGRAGAA